MPTASQHVSCSCAPAQHDWLRSARPPTCLPACVLPFLLPGRKNELQTRILAYLGELDPASLAATVALGRSVPQAPRDQWRMEQAGAGKHDRRAGLPAGVLCKVF